MVSTRHDSSQSFFFQNCKVEALYSTKRKIMIKADLYNAFEYVKKSCNFDIKGILKIKTPNVTANMIVLFFNFLTYTPF